MTKKKAAKGPKDISLRPLRPLLPSPPDEADDPLHAEGEASSKDAALTRATVSAACETCRRRKVKCSAERPACAQCALRGGDCRYTTGPTETHFQALKRKHADLETQHNYYQEFYNLLQTLSSEEGSNVLKHVREGASVNTVIRYVKNGDLHRQLSLRPEAHYRYEFPYSMEMPSFLDHPQNPYLRSIIYQKVFAASPTVYSSVDFHDQSKPDLCMYLVPYHAGEIYDPRISTTDLSKWTTISSDKHLLQNLLHTYFECEYPFFPFFQKDYFLEDMHKLRTRFCSPLLFNAVLAAASHGYKGIRNRAEFWNPQNLGYQFLAEAKRLLELGRDNTATITTVQATLIISLTCCMNGTDRVGWSYLLKAIALAEKIELFKDMSGKSKRTRIVRSLTAWSLYNFQAQFCFHFYRQPLLKDPNLPFLPDPGKDATYYGEVWIKYTQAESPLPSHFGYCFKAMSQFRRIMNDICVESFTEDSTIKGLPLARLMDFRMRLEYWFRNLPEPLQEKNIVLPTHLKIHIHYHIVIIALFEHLDDETSINIEMPFADDSKEATPAQILANSKACLETLVRLYYLRHGFEHYDPFMVQPFVTLGYNAFRNLSQAPMNASLLRSIRSTLLLSVKGLREQGSHFYLSEVAFRVIRDSMSPDDLHILKNYITIDNEQHRRLLADQHVHSEWPVNIISVAQDPENYRLDKLVRTDAGPEVIS